MDREVGGPLQILPQQPVGVFVRAAPPWRAQTAEEAPDIRGHGKAGMIGHFTAALPGQRCAELTRLFPGLSDQRRDHALHILVGDLDQRDKAGVAPERGGDRSISSTRTAARDAVSPGGTRRARAPPRIDGPRPGGRSYTVQDRTIVAVSCTIE